MRAISFSIVVTVIALLTGCKATPLFVGKWTSKSDMLGMPMTSVTENNADGTFRTVSTVQKVANSPSLVITDTGTWKLDGNKLTLTIKDIDWKVAGGSDVQAKKAAEMFAANKTQMIQQANANPTRTLFWISNDAFTFSDTGKTYAYTRAR